METLDDFWDAVTEPCGLPEWFGRNTDAWRELIDLAVAVACGDSRESIHP